MDLTGVFILFPTTCLTILSLLKVFHPLALIALHMPYTALNSLGYPLSHLSTSSTLNSNLPVVLLHFKAPVETALLIELLLSDTCSHTSRRLNHFVVPPILIRDLISFKISSIRNSILVSFILFCVYFSALTAENYSIL